MRAELYQECAKRFWAAIGAAVAPDETVVYTAYGRITTTVLPALFAVLQVLPAKEDCSVENGRVAQLAEQLTLNQ